MSMRPLLRRSGGGFTLLEATIALAILATAAVVCLEMRAQGIVRARALAEARSTEETLRTILDLANAGLLIGASEPVGDDPRQRRVWRGDERGELWECVSERVEMPNPARSALAPSIAAQMPAMIVLERTTVSYRGRAATSLRAVRS